MALKIITPFRSDNYRTIVSGFVGWVADYVQSNQIQDRTGWMSQLQRYEWKGDWREGMRKRCEFHERMMCVQSDQDFHQVAGDILSWGRMNPFGFEEVSSLRRSLMILDTLREGKDTFFHDLFVDRVAASSKIYEMYDPSSWAIYDSNVVRGLAFLVTTWWKMNGRKTMDSVLRFPWPPGRGDAGPPQGFPRAASPRQAQLGFIYASWLLSAMAEKIRSMSRNSGNAIDQDFDWQAYHVEMVLFTLGKHAA